MTQFSGTGVAIVTPFDKHRNVDYQAIKRLIKHLTDGNVNFIVVQGTTGETPVLTADEKTKVLQTVIEANTGKLPVVLGIGGNNTAEVVHEIQTRDLKGVDAILSVTPYYSRPTQAGLYAHYKAVAESTTLPIILYNVPSRTGVNLTAETCVRLAQDFKNIIAVKEASGNWMQIMKIVKNKPEHFTVLSGDDALCVPQFAIGVQGVISVVANAYPAEFSQMVKSALSNDFASARTIHFKLLNFTESVFAENNPAGIKAALEMLEICESEVRLPLTDIGGKNYVEIEMAIKEMM